MKKIRVSIVSYLNSRPFLWGLESSPISAIIDISVDTPSEVADKLASGKADIGLIPVASLAELKYYRLVSDYCLGTEGKVRTVVIAGQVPIEQAETILMDYQSRTSVVLAKILAKHHWRKNFNWKKTHRNFENRQIKGKTVAVVIGDRVFNVEKKYLFIYDLTEEWRKFTGMAFVFAVWASNADLPGDFCRLFNEALKNGINMIPSMTETLKSEYPGVNIADYLSGNISFEFDVNKQAALKMFLKMAEEINF